MPTNFAWGSEEFCRLLKPSKEVLLISKDATSQLGYFIQGREKAMIQYFITFSFERICLQNVNNSFNGHSSPNSLY